MHWELRRTNLDSRSQEDITEEVMFRERLGEHVEGQWVEKNGEGLSFSSTIVWVCSNFLPLFP